MVWHPLPPIPPCPAVASGMVDAAARLLRSGEPTVLLLDDVSLRADGLALAGRIAAKSGAQLLAQTFNARVERGASRVPVERVPYFVDLALAVFKEVRHSSGCLPAEKFPTFASRRQGRERVALLDFRRRFHLTRLRDVAQEESPA